MRAAFKEKSFVALWVIITLLIVSTLGYFALAKPKSSGMTFGAEVISIEDTKQLDILNKYKTPYAFKVKDNDKLYLRYFYYENNASVPKESNFEISKDRYDKLKEGNKYWFTVKFSKANDESKGIVTELMTENPAR